MYVAQTLKNSGRLASIIMVLGVVCLPGMQNLTIEHDIAHAWHNHEETELCEILDFYGSSTLLIAAELPLPSYLHSEGDIAVPSSVDLDAKVNIIHRTRAPPSPSHS
jgi:hypothetical protein